MTRLSPPPVRSDPQPFDPAAVCRLTRELAPQIASLPRLSCVVEQFLQHVGRDTASTVDIAAALSLDPVLHGWVLRQANSGFCKLNRPVVSIAEACVVLGLGTVTRLVYAACTRDLLRRRLHCYRYLGNGFWLHGLAVGLAAKHLVELLGTRAPLGAESAQVAGLLHDVGKLLLDERLPRAKGPREITVAEEIALAGFDHGLGSAAVAATWSLPDDLVVAMATHHGDNPADGGCVLALADRLVGHWGVGGATYPRLDREPPLEDLLTLGHPLVLAEPQVSRWCRELPPLLEGLAQMVQAIGHGTPPALPPGAPVPAPSSRASSRRSQRRSQRPSRRSSPRERTRGRGRG